VVVDSGNGLLAVVAADSECSACRAGSSGANATVSSCGRRRRVEKTARLGLSDVGRGFRDFMSTFGDVWDTIRERSGTSGDEIGQTDD
jgi:hypothetical protein